MSTIKDFTMRQYNGIDYDTLYPKSTSQQVLLNDSELASNLGLSGDNPTVNDGLNQLYPIWMYKWLRHESYWVENEGEISSAPLNITTSSSTYSIQNSDTIEFDSITGTFALVNPTTFTLHIRTNPSTVEEVQNALRNKYWMKQNFSSGNTVYYSNDSAVAVITGATSAPYYLIEAQTLTSSNNISVYPPEYTNSESSYTPGTIEQDGKTITSFLSGNLLNACHVEYGYYVGMGTGVTLNFEITPKIVFIFSTESSDTGFVCVLFGKASASIGSLSVTWTGNTLSWTNALHTQNEIYEYMALI